MYEQEKNPRRELVKGISAIHLGSDRPVFHLTARNGAKHGAVQRKRYGETVQLGMRKMQMVH